jgi:hypothetical protein
MGSDFTILCFWSNCTLLGHATSRSVVRKLQRFCTGHARFEGFMAATMKNAVFWDIKAQLVLHRRHYVTSTKCSRLVLCKIWGFYGSYYEESRFLGLKSPVRTSQETHYVSAAEPSQLMLCKIWAFHGSDYEECRFLGYKSPVRTSQETYYVSSTESSRLILCKILGFHGSDCEECRFLGYKNPVRTSQETHYVSATEPSRLLLYKNWAFHGGDYEEWHLVGCDAVWPLYEPTFMGNVSPP